MMVGKRRNLWQMRDAKDLSFGGDLLHFLADTGLELTTGIQLQGTLTPPAEEYDLDKCLAWAFEYRPELLR